MQTVGRLIDVQSFLACRRVVEPNRLAGGGDRFSVERERDALNFVPGLRERLHLFPRFHIPQPEDSRGVPAGQELTVGRKRQRAKTALTADKSAQLLAGGDVPKPDEESVVFAFATT